MEYLFPLFVVLGVINKTTTAILASIALSLYMLYYAGKNRKKLMLTPENAFVLIALILYFVSYFYAADQGMALIGAVKRLPLLPFAFILPMLGEKKKERLLKSIPLSGAIVVVGSLLLSLIPGLKDLFFIANRLAGSFQYPNSLAMYLLLGLSVIFAFDITFRKKWQNILVSLILLTGLFLTGSRTVFVLFFVGLFGILVKLFKENKKLLSGIFAATASLLLVLFMVEKTRGIILRLFMLELNSSSMLGRFLYVRDAFFMLFDHPLGTGAYGYSVMQGLYATGLYNVKYVHNDFLQLGLDIGIVPMLGLFALLIYVIVRIIRTKEGAWIKLLILCIMLIHNAFDIDGEFMAFVMAEMAIIDFCLKNADNKERGLKLKVYVPAVIVIAISLLASPVGLAQYGYTRGDYDFALKCFPMYTDAREIRVRESMNYEQIVMDAEYLYEHNPYSATGCQMMGALSYVEKDYENMCGYYEKELMLLPYDATEYNTYIELLDEVIAESEGDMKDFFMEKKEEARKEKDERLKRMSELGKAIKDQPEF